jgi:hypothetical protein
MTNKALPSTTWRPGQSGNPHGRPPGTEARDQARQHATKAIQTLVKALDDKRHCVYAAVATLDRQEPETLNTNVSLDLTGIDVPERPTTIESAKEWLERRKRELAEGDDREPPQTIN